MYLRANCTKVIPHRMLQIHPTISINDIICRRADRIFNPNAFAGGPIRVLPQQNTVKDDNNVPAMTEIYKICYYDCIYVMVKGPVVCYCKGTSFNSCGKGTVVIMAS